MNTELSWREEGFAFRRYLSLPVQKFAFLSKREGKDHCKPEIRTMRKIQTELTEKKAHFFPAQKMQISVFIFLIQSPVVVVVINSGA